MNLTECGGKLLTAPTNVGVLAEFTHAVLPMILDTPVQFVAYKGTYIDKAQSVDQNSP